MAIDHRSFEVRPVEDTKSLRAHAEELRRQQSRKYWWLEDDEEELSKAVFAALDTIKSSQRDHREDYRFFSKLYGDRDNLAGPATPEDALEGHEEEQLPDNVIRQGIETRQSNVCMHQSRPAYSTSGGSWSQRKRAKLLNQFVDGHFYESGVDELAPRVWLDDEKCGLGAAKVYEENGRMCVERALPWELIVDEEAARYGKPQELFQDRNLSKVRMMLDYNDQAQDIQRASMDRSSSSPDIQGHAVEDFVRVVEAWRLPSRKGAKDGRHVICVSTCVLVDEKWEDDSFPFAFHVTRPPAEGFRGQGMVERLMGYQLAINRLNQTKGEIIRICPVPRWFTPRSARISEEYLTNEVGGNVPYDGPNPPTLINASYVPAEYFEEIRNIKMEVLKECGVSEFAQSGVKPAGLDSAPAQRTFEEITNKRLSEAFKAHDRFRMDLGKLLINGARRIYRRQKEEAERKSDVAPSYRVRLPGKMGFQEIDWGKIELDEDAYVTKPSPISSVPSTWTGKLQSAMEIISTFGVSPERAMLLVQMPDVEQYGSLLAAALECADWAVDQILEEGRYIEPEPFFHLQFHMEAALLAFNRAVMAKYPDRRLSLLRQYIGALTARQAEIEPPPAPPMAGPPAPQLPPPPGMAPDMGPGLLPPAPPAPPIPLAA